MSFLLILTLILPFFNVFLVFLRKGEKQINQKSAYIFSKICAISFLAILFGLLRDPNHNLEILQFNSQISFAIEVNKVNIKQLFLLSFIWLVVIFYSEKFLFFAKSEKNSQFIYLLPSFVACLNLIILSKNLPTLLFSYNFLLLIFALIFHKFIILNEDRKSYIFIFIILFEAILLFLVAILITQFAQNISFTKNGVGITASKAKSIFILILFLSSVLLSIFSSSFFLYHKNINFVALENYLAFPIFLGFAKILVFTKIIAQIFGVGLFSSLISQNFALIFEILCAISIVSTLIFILFSADFRSIFFYLFLNQLSVAFLTIFVFAYADEGNIYKVFINFALSTTLVFIVLANFTLYLKNSQNKDFSGIFYNLKITISLLIFVFLNFASLLPPFAFQNISLLKICLEKQLVVTFFVLATNSLALLLFVYKLAFPTFAKENIVISQSDVDLAKKIDFSSSLSLTACVVAFIMIILPIIEIFYKIYR